MSVLSQIEQIFIKNIKANKQWKNATNVSGKYTSTKVKLYQLQLSKELKCDLLKHCFISVALKHITCFFWLKKFLYTFFAPNSQMSLSSVMVPSVSDATSKKAHWASASIGAMMYGMPKS
jgi:hypothetical protein